MPLMSRRKSSTGPLVRANTRKAEPGRVVRKRVTAPRVAIAVLALLAIGLYAGAAIRGRVRAARTAEELRRVEEAVRQAQHADEARLRQVTPR